MHSPTTASDHRHDPRSFCGEGFPWPLIAELSVGDEIVACYVVRDSRLATTKSNKPYLRLLLGDRTGTIDGVAWDDAEHWEPLCAAESVIGVCGRVDSFNDRLQLKIHSVEPLRAGPADYERLLPASPRDRADMERELDAAIRSIGDAGLRRLLLRCLGPATELGQAYRTHPAAKRNHHAYVSGLLEHSLSVAAACDRLAAHYRAQGVRLDRDLLVAAAILHDIGKLRELRGFPASGYTTEGQLLGHIVIGIQMIERVGREIDELPADRLLLLLHLVASHQGKPEWDSPKRPQLLEGLVLHYADDLDAKMNQANALIAGVAAGEWTHYDRALERAFFRPPEMSNAADGESVSTEEAAELMMDLFR